jgi:hypothetical protein
VHGTFQAVEDEEQKKRIFDQILVRHPHMKDFLEHPEAEIISVHVSAFLFLDGITDAHHISL